MTPEERATAMTTRNANIVAYYTAGNKLKAVAQHFGLGRQRIMQILQAAGAWTPYVKGDRTKFLGVNVTERTREALSQKAEERGVSVSRFASDALDEMVAK